MQRECPTNVDMHCCVSTFHIYVRRLVHTGERGYSTYFDGLIRRTAEHFILFKLQAPYPIHMPFENILSEDTILPIPIYFSASRTLLFPIYVDLFCILSEPPQWCIARYCTHKGEVMGFKENFPKPVGLINNGVELFAYGAR